MGVVRRLSRPVRRPIDSATAAAAYARPGQDTRSWVSFGLVHHQDPKQIVTFDEEYGCPLVCVTLQPSGSNVHCRVSSMVAGNGEGEWHPFVEGDEVLVVLPEGHESAGPVIIGRLNNSLDKFPMDSVAGQDPTTNVFAFRRRRTPFIEEFLGPSCFGPLRRERSCRSTRSARLRCAMGIAMLFRFQVTCLGSSPRTAKPSCR